jgi:hypothetical protein
MAAGHAPGEYIPFFMLLHALPYFFDFDFQYRSNTLLDKGAQAL